jgi:hypothetical protein
MNTNNRNLFGLNTHGTYILNTKYTTYYANIQKYNVCIIIL